MDVQSLQPAAEYLVLTGLSTGYDVELRATARTFQLMAPSMGQELQPYKGGPLTSEATIELLERVRRGDEDALDSLLQRCIPALRRWAHGRLPAGARGMQDTADLVQDTVVAALKKLDAFDARHQGALQAYLRQAVMNRIRDLIRHRKRRPDQVELPEDLIDERTSPLEEAIGSENIARYERALERLTATDREAIIGRLEFQYSYEELAIALDKPSASAARMAVTRAMKRLAGEMVHG
jgi:RNA polymerase sigma-70 factor, ECF subfamily